MTAKEAMDTSIRLWDWLAETGKYKYEWPEWKRNGGTVWQCMNDCLLCELGSCEKCPMFGHWGTKRKRFHCSAQGSLYHAWSRQDNADQRKAAAAAIVARLREVRAKMEVENG